MAAEGRAGPKPRLGVKPVRAGQRAPGFQPQDGATLGQRQRLDMGQKPARDPASARLGADEHALHLAIPRRKDQRAAAQDPAAVARHQEPHIGAKPRRDGQGRARLVRNQRLHLRAAFDQKRCRLGVAGVGRFDRRGRGAGRRAEGRGRGHGALAGVRSAPAKIRRIGRQRDRIAPAWETGLCHAGVWHAASWQTGQPRRGRAARRPSPPVVRPAPLPGPARWPRGRG